MKKIFLMCFIVILISILLPNTIMAKTQEGVSPINALGKTQLFIDLLLKIETCKDIDGNRFSLEMKNSLSEEVFSALDEEQQNWVIEHSNINDYIVVLNLCSPNKDNPYPEIEPLKIKISVDERIGGSRNYLMGANYRLYRFDDAAYEVEITETSIKEVGFIVEELGYYVLYYNPCVYNVDFFADEIEYDENRNIVNEVYFTAINLAQFDNLYFPEIPKKEGYVFNGWKQNKRKGAYDTYCYIEYEKDILLDEWKMYPCDVRNIYASWCPEDEYTPLKVTIESENRIVKGKEDGQEIIITLSEGKFDEAIDEDVENDWKIVGSDELKVASVERIDDTTAKLTLAGNSSDECQKGELQIEFNSRLYISCEYDDYNMTIYEVADVQLDEKGVKKARFISDNAIVLNEIKTELSIVQLSENYVEVETRKESGVVILVVYNSEGIVNEVITKKAEKRVAFDNVDLRGDTMALMQWNGINMMESITEKVTAKIHE